MPLRDAERIERIGRNTQSVLKDFSKKKYARRAVPDCAILTKCGVLADENGVMWTGGSACSQETGGFADG